MPSDLLKNKHDVAPSKFMTSKTGMLHCYYRFRIANLVLTQTVYFSDSLFDPKNKIILSDHIDNDNVMKFRNCEFHSVPKYLLFGMASLARQKNRIYLPTTSNNSWTLIPQMAAYRLNLQHHHAEKTMRWAPSMIGKD